MPRKQNHYNFRQVTIQPFTIFEMVKKETGYTKKQLLEYGTDNPYTYAERRKRTAARRMWAEIAYVNNYSYPRIGKYLNRDHTTIMYYLGKRPARYVKKQAA